MSSGVYRQPEGQGAALCRRRPSLQQLLCNPRPSPLPPALSPRRPRRLGRAARAGPGYGVCASGTGGIRGGGGRLRAAGYRRGWRVRGAVGRISSGGGLGVLVGLAGLHPLVPPFPRGGRWYLPRPCPPRRLW